MKKKQLNQKEKLMNEETIVTTAYEERLLATIKQLKEELYETSYELNQARKWNTITSQMLLHRETQVQNIIAALGEDAIPEHEGITKFRDKMNERIKEMNNASNGETNG